MQTTVTHIVSVLMLIISFHGIFLSVFFFFKSYGKFNTNFFMGLLLLAMSTLSLIQLISLINPALIPIYPNNSEIFHNLLLGPFQFLYTALYIRSGTMHKMRFHLLLILIILVIFSLTGIMQGFWKEIMVVTLYIINSLYYFQTLRLFAGFIKVTATGWRHAMSQDYSLVTIINLLIFVNLILAALCPVVGAGMFSIIMHLPKGIMVYYIYYLILRTADLSMGAGECG